MFKLFSSRCYNGGNKHNFKARYSEESKPTIIPRKIGEATEGAIESLINSSRHIIKKYHYDICSWCGKINELSKNN